MAKIIIRLTIAIAALAAAMCFNVPAGRAFGDASWCKMINKGDDEVYFDCQYRTFEACSSSMDRGFCNLNPSPGSSAPNAVAQPKHRKRQA
jgi:hypothetical protein